MMYLNLNYRALGVFMLTCFTHAVDLKFTSIATLGGELLDNAPQAYISPYFLLLDHTNDKVIWVGITFDESKSHQSCIGTLPVDDVTRAVDVIYGNCSQQLGTDSNSPLDLDGYGEEAVVISPASPQQLSDGRIMFIDDGRLIRVLRDGEVFTKTELDNGGSLFARGLVYFEDRGLLLYGTGGPGGAAWIDEENGVSNTGLPGDPVGIHPHNRDYVWLIKGNGGILQDMSKFTNNPSSEANADNIQEASTFARRKREINYEYFFSLNYEDNVCQWPFGLPCPVELNTEYGMLNIHPDFADQIFLVAVNPSPWLSQLNTDNGTLTKICIAGKESVDTENANVKQCQLQGDVNAMMWKDETTLLLYENNTGFREAKFSIGRDNCWNKPCANAGSCFDREEAYICMCGPHFTGETCSEDIKECSENYCSGNGTCTELQEGGKVCVCNRGYTGAYCGDLINPCNSSPCINDSKCVADGNHFICECSNNTEKAGELCQKELLGIERCDELPCLDNAVCSDVVGEGAFHSCNNDWSGIDCDKKVHGCQSHPCLNDGTCIEDGCVCKQGWSGKRCETEMKKCTTSMCDPQSEGKEYGHCLEVVGSAQCYCELSGITDISVCHPNPCKNGGTCHLGSLNSFTCECPAGWTGHLCAERVDHCGNQESSCSGGSCIDFVDSGTKCLCRHGLTKFLCDDEQRQLDMGVKKDQPPANKLRGLKEPQVLITSNLDGRKCFLKACNSNGECIETLTEGYVCQCSEGYTGVRCGTAVNRCYPNPCHNNGVCNTDDTDGFMCGCSNGWSGTNCQNEVPQCDSNHCNNGDCAELAGDGMICNCLDGYTGPSCNISVCHSNPCVKGDCQVKVDGTLNCLCDVGWHGKLCTDVLDRCSETSCSNHGVCQAIAGARYECLCEDGWNGDDCSNNIDECQNLPCLNGGLCKDHINSFICQCLGDWSGDVCERKQMVEVLLPDSSVGSMQLPAGEDPEILSKDQKECPDIGPSVPTQSEESTRVTMNVTSEKCTTKLSNKNSPEHKAFGRRFAESIIEAMPNVPGVTVEIKSIICGSLIVDFEVIAPPGERVGDLVEESLYKAVQSNSIKGFSVSSESFSAKKITKASKVAEVSAHLNMTLKDDRSDYYSSGNLRFGGRGKFHCRAYLQQPLAFPEQLEGMSLVFTDRQGIEHNAGCFDALSEISHDTLFVYSNKKCPVFDKNAKEYTAEIVFDVTNPFIGAIDYRCLLHTRYQLNHQTGMISVISGTSEAVKITGLKKPIVTLVPKTVSGFGGEIRNVECNATGGFPVGKAKLTYGNQRRPIEDISVKTVTSGGNIKAQIELSKSLVGQKLFCSSDAYPDVVVNSERIAVTFIESKSETIQIIDIRGEAELDCSLNINTNGISKYQWQGNFGKSSQDRMQKLVIPYLKFAKYTTLRTTCMVEISNDPLERKFNFTYILNFIYPSASQNRGSDQQQATPSGYIVLSLVAVTLLAVTLVVLIVGYLAVRKKISNRTRPCEEKPLPLPIRSIQN